MCKIDVHSIELWILLLSIVAHSHTPELMYFFAVYLKNMNISMLSITL